MVKPREPGNRLPIWRFIMDENTKAILGAIIAAPILYFLLVVVMSF
jgi:hypothetical protein